VCNAKRVAAFQPVAPAEAGKACSEEGSELGVAPGAETEAVVGAQQAGPTGELPSVGGLAPDEVEPEAGPEAGPTAELAGLMATGHWPLAPMLHYMHARLQEACSAANRPVAPLVVCALCVEFQML